MDAERQRITQTIKTPQELVHIRHSISLRQYKYWVLMLKAYREAYERGNQPEGDYLKIPMTELIKFLGYEPVKKELKEDLEAIRIEPIIYNFLGKDGNQVMRGSGFISEWEVSSRGIAFKLPGFLEEVIRKLDLKDSIFQQLNWNVFNSFSGKYEAILYKLCKDYMGVQRTPYMTLQELRNYMGVEPDEYTDFKRFSQWVLSRPIKRINEDELAEITIEAVYRREGRRVVGMHFIVKPKSQSVLDFGDDPAFRLAKVSIPIAKQKEYLALHSPEQIENSIMRANIYMMEQEEQGKTIQNVGGVYKTAITEDWGAEYAAKLKLEQEREAKEAENRKREADAAAAKKSDRQRANARSTEKLEAALALYNLESEDQREALWSRFMGEIGNTLPAAKTKGLESASVRKVFSSWLVKIQEQEE